MADTLEKWPGLRRLADTLAHESGAPLDTVNVFTRALASELGPLLEAFDKLLFLAGPHVSDHTLKESLKERGKWRRR